MVAVWLAIHPHPRGRVLGTCPRGGGTQGSGGTWRVLGAHTAGDAMRRDGCHQWQTDRRTEGYSSTGGHWDVSSQSTASGPAWDDPQTTRPMLAQCWANIGDSAVKNTWNSSSFGNKWSNWSEKYIFLSKILSHSNIDSQNYYDPVKRHIFYIYFKKQRTFRFKQGHIYILVTFIIAKVYFW